MSIDDSTEGEFHMARPQLEFQKKTSFNLHQSHTEENVWTREKLLTSDDLVASESDALSLPCSQQTLLALTNDEEGSSKAWSHRKFYYENFFDSLLHGGDCRSVAFLDARQNSSRTGVDSFHPMSETEMLSMLPDLRRTQNSRYKSRQCGSPNFTLVI